LSPGQGAAGGGAECRCRAPHGHRCRTGRDIRIRTLGLSRRHRGDHGGTAVYDLLDHGDPVWHQSVCGRHPRRPRQCLGRGRGGPDLRNHGSAHHRARGLDLQSDRDLCARDSRACAVAERLVRPRRGQEGMKLAAVAAIVIGVGLFIWRANGYELYVLALVGLTTIVGVGLNVLLGMSGQISLGHAAFYAIGAYVVGIFTTKLDWTVWAALPLAGLIAGAAGVLLAIPALRVRGPYLAMVTIAFGFVLEQGSAEWEALTGGWNGLLGIPLPSVAGFAFSEREMVFAILAFTLLSLVLYARLSASPWGKAMRAVRDAEVASQSIGIDPTLIRATAFGISAIAAGIAG